MTPTHCPLFTGITDSNLATLLKCLNATQKRFAKNSTVLATDKKLDSVGIVLSGAVHVVREDFWGKHTLMARIESGGLFGEAFACADIEKFPFSVIAAEPSDILFVKCNRILASCPSACKFHATLIKNLTLILAQKNIALAQKLKHLPQPTTRDKLLSYLSEQAQLNHSTSFTIPFNREQLADYLSVDRSALSAVLSHLKKDRLLHYHKNHFELR